MTATKSKPPPPPESSDTDYYKRWYEEHGEAYNDTRRNRYATDPAYKAAVLKRNRDARAKRREEAEQIRARVDSARKVEMPTRDFRVVEVTEGGRKVPAYTVGALALVLNRSLPGIRALEASGVIPAPKNRSPKGDRVYTEVEITAIHRSLVESGRLSRATGPRDLGLEPKVRWVQYGDEAPRKVALFRVGALARAMGRRVVTVEQLEANGVLPETPFRGGEKVRYRLYTLEQIEAVTLALTDSLRGESEQAAFRDTVRQKWEAQGVFRARIVAPPEGGEDEVER